VKRSGFKSAFQPCPAKTMEAFAPRAREMAVPMAGAVSRPSVAAPKFESARSEAYRRLVAAMPCIACGAVGRSQCAHSNYGKGLALKADDRESFPLCGPTLSRFGCHADLDQGAKYSKAQRRRLENEWSRTTRAAIRASGQWPATLAQWPADTEDTAA